MTAREFSFPLNVYGALLEWTQGRLDHLHYGLFDRADEPVIQAQERASERLWAQMPPPCRVLEVGIGVGTTLQRLRERGYDPLGVTPEPAQADPLPGNAMAPTSPSRSRGWRTWIPGMAPST